ncbi:MAG: PilZ domain-containing protein [Myxococcales bacterium]|nr:PilZ domain-containing protein [Myxococcales bacterium]
MTRLGHSLRLLTPSVVRSACGGLPPDRRAEMRRALHLACLVRRWNGALVGHRALDISPAGMLLLSDEHVERGTLLQVSFMATELPLWFDTTASVARLVRGRRAADAGPALGLRFSSLPAVSRLILRAALQKAPPTIAQRELPPELTRNGTDYLRALRDALG